MRSLVFQLLQLRLRKQTFTAQNVRQEAAEQIKQWLLIRARSLIFFWADSQRAFARGCFGRSSSGYAVAR